LSEFKSNNKLAKTLEETDARNQEQVRAIQKYAKAFEELTTKNAVQAKTIEDFNKTIAEQAKALLESNKVKDKS